MHAQNKDSAMRVIRARYERINGDASHFRQYETSLDSLGLEHWTTGRGRLIASFEGDTLRTIVASYASPRGHATESYYFWDGAPFEVKVKLRSDTGGAKSAPGTAEQRFYFNRGYLVRWVDPQHTIRPITTGAVFARAMQLMADGTRLVDAAHRARDHAPPPPAPADLADAMRRELRGLAAAESTYYASKSKYSKDVITVGYHPVPTVQITLLDANERGWAARATTSTLPGKSCVVYLGRPKKAPKTSNDHAHPDTEREVACDRP
jgi:hypothetical protein